MDVYKLIATLILILVGTPVAELGIVEFKLGGKKIVLPLNRPIHVTHVKSSDLANLKLPIPDLSEVITHVTPPLPPQLPHQQLPPDRSAPSQIYEPSYSPQPPNNIYANHQASIIHVPETHLPDNNPELRPHSPNRHYSLQTTQPIYYPDRVSSQQRFPIPYRAPAHSILYLEEAENRIRNHPLPQLPNDDDRKSKHPHSFPYHTSTQVHDPRQASQNENKYQPLPQSYFSRNIFPLSRPQPVQYRPTVPAIWYPEQRDGNQNQPKPNFVSNNYPESHQYPKLPTRVKNQQLPLLQPPTNRFPVLHQHSSLYSAPGHAIQYPEQVPLKGNQYQPMPFPPIHSYPKSTHFTNSRPQSQSQGENSSINFSEKKKYSIDLPPQSRRIPSEVSFNHDDTNKHFDIVFVRQLKDQKDDAVHLHNSLNGLPIEPRSDSPTSNVPLGAHKPKTQEEHMTLLKAEEAYLINENVRGSVKSSGSRALPAHEERDISLSTEDYNITPYRALNLPEAAVTSVPTPTLADDAVTSHPTPTMAENAVTLYPTPLFANDIVTSDPTLMLPEYAVTSHPTPYMVADVVTSHNTLMLTGDAVTSHPTPYLVEDAVTSHHTLMLPGDADASRPTPYLVEDVMTSHNTLMLPGDAVTSHPTLYLVEDAVTSHNTLMLPGDAVTSHPTPYLVEDAVTSHHTLMLPGDAVTSHPTPYLVEDAVTSHNTLMLPGDAVTLHPTPYLVEDIVTSHNTLLLPGDAVTSHPTPYLVEDVVTSHNTLMLPGDAVTSHPTPYMVADVVTSQNTLMLTGDAVTSHPTPYLVEDAVNSHNTLMLPGDADASHPTPYLVEDAVTSHHTLMLPGDAVTSHPTPYLVEDVVTSHNTLMLPGDAVTSHPTPYLVEDAVTSHNTLMLPGDAVTSHPTPYLVEDVVTSHNTLMLPGDAVTLHPTPYLVEDVVTSHNTLILPGDAVTSHPTPYLVEDAMTSHNTLMLPGDAVTSHPTPYLVDVVTSHNTLMLPGDAVASHPTPYLVDVVTSHNTLMLPGDAVTSQFRPTLAIKEVTLFSVLTEVPEKSQTALYSLIKPMKSKFVKKTIKQEKSEKQVYKMNSITSSLRERDSTTNADEIFFPLQYTTKNESAQNTAFESLKQNTSTRGPDTAVTTSSSEQGTTNIMTEVKAPGLVSPDNTTMWNNKGAVKKMRKGGQRPCKGHRKGTHGGSGRSASQNSLGRRRRRRRRRSTTFAPASIPPSAEQ